MKLVEMANEAGGKDNITVQLVEFAVSIKKEKAKNKESNKKPSLAIGLAIIVILAILLIAYFLFFLKNKTDKSDSNEIVQMERTDQVEAIPNESIPVPYKKGSSATIETKIPENEQIVEYKVTKGEQFIKEVRTEGRYIIIQWPDKDFSNTDLNEAEIEISLKTDRNNEYTQLIKVLATSEQEPNSLAPSSPAQKPVPSPQPPAPPSTPTPPPMPTPAPPSAPVPTPAPSEETPQADTNSVEPKIQPGEELKTEEQGSKGVE
jgi:hypothetical protein